MLVRMALHTVVLVLEAAIRPVPVPVHPLRRGSPLTYHLSVYPYRCREAIHPELPDHYNTGTTTVVLCRQMSLTLCCHEPHTLTKASDDDDDERMTNVRAEMGLVCCCR